MKRPLQEAAELFRKLETSESQSGEFYRAMSLVADGLHSIEKRLDQLEEAAKPAPNAVFRGRSRLIPGRAIIRAFPA